VGREREEELGCPALCLVADGRGLGETDQLAATTRPRSLQSLTAVRMSATMSASTSRISAMIRSIRDEESTVRVGRLDARAAVSHARHTTRFLSPATIMLQFLLAALCLLALAVGARAVAILPKHAPESIRSASGPRRSTPCSLAVFLGSGKSSVLEPA
jgi:hypothetical protein